MNLVYTIYKNQSINVFHNGEIFNIEYKDKRFNLIESLLINNKHSEVIPLLDPKIMFQNQKNLTFQDDRVFYKGEIIPVGIANAIFQGIVNNENIGNYLFIWDKCLTKIKEKNTSFWKFQSNKLFYNVYPFEEYLLCLATPDPNDYLEGIDDFIFLNKNNSVKIQHILNFFMKKMNLTSIMKELKLSGDKLKKIIKEKMITNKSVDPYVLFFAEKFKPHLSQDHLIELLSSIPNELFIKTEPLIKFFNIYATQQDNQYNINKIKKILLNHKTLDVLSFISTLENNTEWENFVLPDFKEINELTDFINSEIFKIKCDRYVFNVPSLYPTIESIHFQNNPELRLVLPHSGRDLVTWGQAVGNCIGSETYMKKAYNNESLLIAFSVNDVITFTLEIVAGKIKQFEETKGFNNKKPIYKQIICDELLKKNIIIKH